MNNERTKRRSLLNLTVLYTVGNFSSKVLSFILVFFTTFYLSKEDVGYYDLILITVSLLIPLVSFQIQDAILRWLLDDDEIDNQSKVFSNSLFLVFFNAIILGIVTFFFDLLFSFQYIGLIYLTIVMQSIYVLLLQFIRGLGNSKLYVGIGIAYTLLYVLFTILFIVFLNFKVLGLLYSNLIACFCLTSFLIIHQKVYKFFLIKDLNISYLKGMLNYSIPLIPNSMSWWVISSANRYIIMFYLGAAANGIFAISYKIPSILLMFINIFYLAWQEKAIIMYVDENRDHYYSNILNKYIQVLFSISILIISCNKIILEYIVAPSFFEAWKYTPLIMLGILFSAISGFYGTIYLGAKKTKHIFVGSILAGLITIVSSFILIPIIDLYGAGLSILLGYMALFIFRVVHIRKFSRIKLDKNKCFLFLITYITVSLITFSNNSILLYGNVLIALVSLLFLNYEQISACLKKRLNNKQE